MIFPAVLAVWRFGALGFNANDLVPQQASQHKSFYQRISTLPKRPCPRRGKLTRDNGAKEHGKPNDAPTTKPRPCVKTMLSADALQLTLRHANQGINRAINMLNVRSGERQTEFVANLEANLADVDVAENRGNIVMR